MRIYQMIATFGKLEHQTLTLEPGLNIITAPNEWGKSTWCAFLIAMLYGIDTRAKTTKNALADKDRYAPWSGAPMEGRIDLNWQGRDITIERRSTPRIPLGDFRAYETNTGITVPELTAANCGQLLLGVEQSVYRRSGFIRLADLPVTQDEALRRRLNALVTTGDENDAADRLAASLKELRNRIRYNRTGLLPQAEQECVQLEDALSQLEYLDGQRKTCYQRIDDLKDQIALLNNHRQALEYTAALDHAARAAAARNDLDAALKEVQQLEAACAMLPPYAQAKHTAAQLETLQQELLALQPRLTQLPEEPIAPAAPAPFGDMPLEEARKMVHRDTQDYVAAKRTAMAVLLIIMGILGLCAGCVLIYLKAYMFAIAASAGSLAALIWGAYEKASMARLVKHLQKKYGTKDHSRWAIPLIQYEKQHKQYVAAARRYREISGDNQLQLTSLTDRFAALCGGESPEALLERLKQAVSVHEAYDAARQKAQWAQNHFDALQTAVKAFSKPAFPDELTCSEEETQQMLAEYTQELHRLQQLLGQYQGRMELVGDPAAARKRLELLRIKIHKLENTYSALVLAQETLVQAKEELQRRFAPRITARAQQLMDAMTGGRYSQLVMDTDFSLRALSTEEDTLRDVLWRSDGTMDQLYLSVRLAVAEELIPDAPLVLDDALVRFDDDRMEAAIGILEEMAQNRQIILFTCQSREQHTR